MQQQKPTKSEVQIGNKRERAVQKTVKSGGVDAIAPPIVSQREGKSAQIAH